MNFRFQRAISDSPGTLSMIIYQPSVILEGALRNAQRLSLVAQEEKRVSLFDADSVEVSSHYDNGERIAVVSVIDGDAFSHAFVSFTHSAGSTLYQLLDACATKGNVTIPIGSYPPSLHDIRLPRAVTVHGGAMSRIRQIARAVDAACFIQNGILQIVGTEAPTKIPVLLREDAELVGTPSKTEYGAEFKTRMLPLSLNELVQLESSTLNGTYRIISAAGHGDTKSGDWVCSYIAIDNNAFGVKNSSVWR